ncbi:hypothetical protein WMY93_006352 [Mugilogobius chulae]|uniref:A-kinase anchor protein 2 C-terminal domain-containing protein n=1 Tax=Mugilogobius chulae TaxID=88201 RepID=A0AAW0PT93_9GOBI
MKRDTQTIQLLNHVQDKLHKQDVLNENLQESLNQLKQEVQQEKQERAEREGELRRTKEERHLLQERSSALEQDLRRTKEERHLLERIAACSCSVILPNDYPQHWSSLLRITVDVRLNVCGTEAAELDWLKAKDTVCFQLSTSAQLVPMETKPTAYHSLDEWVSESQISAGATIYNPSAQDKKAPTGQPEEENIDKEDASETKLPDMYETTLERSAETQNMTKGESTSCEEFLPPPADFCDLTLEEVSSQDLSIKVVSVDLTAENDVSNPLNYMDNSHKRHTDAEFQHVSDATFFSYGVTDSMSTVVTRESTENKSEDIMPIPPFAGESEGEENLEDLFNLDNKYKPSESNSEALPEPEVSDFKQQNDPSPQHVLPPVSDIPLSQDYLDDACNVEVDNCENTVDVSKQQEALCLQCELPPLGVNQEATQQVLSQPSPPLSTVSIEPANPAAVREGSAEVIRESRVGHGIGEGESRQISAENRQYKVSETEAQIRRVLESNQEQKSEKSRLVSFQLSTMESDSCDESDSGVSADFSPGSTLESSSSSTLVLKETPIEREIRRAVEREHSLRRSRGLPNPPSAPEYVEIPLRKAVFRPSLPLTKSERCQGKDKLFAGKKMQQNIYEETQREQDLVKLGKIPGFYDKGTVRQLKERKQLFEAFQKPKDSVKSTSVSIVNDISILENDSLCNKVTKNETNSRNDVNLKNTIVVPEAKTCQIIIIENNSDVPSKRLNTNRDVITVVDSSKEKAKKVEDVTDLDLPLKENPFFKLRSSTSVVKVEQDIREAQERERELRNQRINLYGTRVEGKEGREATIEEHSGSLSSMKAVPVQALPDPSQNEVTTTTTAARNSSGKLGVWPPAAAQKNHHTQVQHCPRTPRQKTPLVQRWESGLINVQDD